MTKVSSLPQYQPDELALLTHLLRSRVFYTHQEAADFFFLDRSRITRHENVSANLPPIGYLTSLAKLVSEREPDPSHAQRHLLQEINAALQDAYKQRPLRSWTELCQYADDYLEKRRKRHVGKQLRTNPAKNDKKPARIKRLNDRLSPASYQELTGMNVYIETITQYLTNPGPPWIINIVGLGGIGKTSLAHAVSQRLIQDGVFDDVGWISARRQNYEPQSHLVTNPAILQTGKIFDKLLSQLVPGIFRSIEIFDEKSLNLLRVRLKEFPHLIVIDNLETLEDIRMLIPQLDSLVKPTKFLLTSRQNLYDEFSVHHIHLKGLNQADSVGLMRREAELRGIKRIEQASDALLEELYHAVGGIPLALRLIVGQANTRATDVILQQLNMGTQGQQEALFAFIFQDAWCHLKVDEQKIWLNMLFATSYGITVEHLKAIADTPTDKLRTALEQLVSLNLINCNDGVTEDEFRYTIHSLTRVYLENMVSILEHNEPPTLATDASADWYQSINNSIHYISTKISQYDIEPFDEEMQELALQTLMLGLKEPSLWEATAPLLLKVSPIMEQAGHRDKWLPYLIQGIAISEERQDAHSEGELRFQIGMLYQLKGEYVAAEQAFGDSAQIFATLAHAANQVKALNRQAYVSRQQRNHQQAETLANQVLKTPHLDDSERAYSKLVLGTIALDKQNFQEALELFQESLDIWATEKNFRMMAWSWTNLGAALRPLKRHDEAIEVYEKAIELFDEIHDPVHLAVTQMNMGNVYLTQDHPLKALEYYKSAKEVFDQVQERLRLAQIQMNMGMVYYQQGHLSEAELSFTLCAEQYEILDNTAMVANSLDGLGLVYMEQQRYAEACDTFRKALKKLALEHDASLSEEIESHLQEAIDMVEEQPNKDRAQPGPYSR